MDESRRPLLCDSSMQSSSRNRFDAFRRQVHRYLNSKVAHYSVLLLVSLDVSCIFADFIIQILRCEGKLPKDEADDSLEALGIIGLVFSCLFVAELLANVWASGLRYFKSWFHCFDATVITASFVIDVLLRGVLEEVASLVIILRLWRVFKIIEELSVGAEEQMEALQERIEMLEKEKADMDSELHELKGRLQGEQS